METRVLGFWGGFGYFERWSHEKTNSWEDLGFFLIAFFEHLKNNILEDFFLQWLPKCLCFRHWKWFEYVPFLVLLLKTKLLGKQQVPKWAESSA